MKSFLVVLFLAFSLGAFGQFDGGVRLDEQAQQAMGSQRIRGKVIGYRICVFSDNSQSARGAAATAMSKLETGFNLSANVVYQNPFFKVYAGYCINRLEASMLLGRLKSVFPSAFIVGEQMPVSSFERSIRSDLDVIPTDI